MLSFRFVVVLVNKVIVYTFSLQPTKLHVFETVDNDRGNKKERCLLQNAQGHSVA